jgi:hypothetical protein
MISRVQWKKAWIQNSGVGILVLFKKYGFDGQICKVKGRKHLGKIGISRGQSTSVIRLATRVQNLFKLGNQWHEGIDCGSVVTNSS